MSASTILLYLTSHKITTNIMETLDDTQLNERHLQVSQSVRVALDSMTYWAKFLAIVGYIGLGLMVLGGLGMIFGSFDAYYGSGSILAMGLVYLVMAAIYFFPVHSLFKFAINMRAALTSNNQGKINAGFLNVASNFRFVGIMTIVVLSLYGLLFIVGLVASAFSM